MGNLAPCCNTSSVTSSDVSYVDVNKAIKLLLTSKADVSPRLDHYVCFASRMFIILQLLGAKASKIKELKMVCLIF